MEKFRRKGLLDVSGAIPCSQEPGDKEGQCSKINQIAHGCIQQCLISPSLEIPHLSGPISTIFAFKVSRHKFVIGCDKRCSAL